MAKPWKEVIASPQYQALPDAEKAAAQEEYFNTVVAPRAGNAADQARSEFFKAYPLPTAKPRASAPRGGKPMAENRPNNVAAPKPSLLEQATDPINRYLVSRVSDTAQANRATGQQLVNVPLGAAQFGVNAAGWVEDKITGGGGPISGAADSFNQYIADRERQYQAEVPDSAASYSGAAIGATLPWLTAPGIKLMETVGTAGRIIPRGTGILRAPSAGARIAVGGSAQGAVAGAVTPDDSGDYSEKESQVKLGATMGAATPLTLLAGAKAVDGVSSAIDYARNPQRVAGRKLAEWYGSEPEAIRQLRQAKQYFPGEQITAAQALQNPRAFAVEKAMGNQPEFKIMAEEVRNANNAARVGVVEDIAKTPAEMEAARQARRAATEPFYRESVNPVSPYKRYDNASSALDSAKGKRMSAEDFDAIDQAGKIVRSVRDGRRSEDEAAQLLSQIQVKSATAQKAIDQANAAVGKNMVDVTRLERDLRGLTLNPSGTVRSFASEQLSLLDQLKSQYGGKIPAANLQGIQQQLSREFNANASRNGFDKSGQYVLGRLNARMNSLLDRSVPGYRENSRKYAQLSQPINDMEAGQAVLRRADGKVLNTAGDEPLTLADLNRAINDDAKATYGLSDGNLQRLLGLRESLKREGTTIRAPGSDTAYNLGADSWLARQLYGDNTGRAAVRDFGLPAAGAFIGERLGGGLGMAVGTTAGTGLSMGLKNRVTAINSRIATEAARGVYDSRVAADMIEQTLRENPNQAQALLQQFPFWRQLIGQN